MAPNGEYVSPLYQQTQPTYLPQSVALSGPRIIHDWEEGQPIPHGYHPETRVRKGAVLTGALLFGIPYLYSAFAASVGSDVASSSNGKNEAAALYVPVLGPFIETGVSSSATVNYILVLDGLAQAAGAGLLIYGLVSPKTILVRNDLAMVTVTPMHLGKDGSGLGLFGRF
jgi:hypothetical protein